MMDDLDDYVNVETVKGTFINYRREENSENIYDDVLHIVEPNTTRSARPESKTVSKSCCVAAAGILGFLCLLLLVGLMVLLVQYTKGNSKWEMETFRVETRYQNLSQEKDQLQANYDRLNNEKDQLQANYDRLNNEKDQLQTTNNRLTKKTDQLEKTLKHNITDCQRIFEGLKAQQWNYFNSRLYHISLTTASWEDSRKDCLQRGADLVIINNNEEQDFLGTLKKSVWIGLSDIETEGTWKWVDGSLLNTTRYWAKSEPNNEGNEDCAETFHVQNRWNDLPCRVKSHWVCEKGLSDYFRLTHQ